jgi:hypothetical protein
MNIKINVELNYSIDGQRPSDESICKAIGDFVGDNQVLLSETVDGTDDWALLLEFFKIKIKS